MAEEAPDYAGIVKRAAHGEYAHMHPPMPSLPQSEAVNAETPPRKTRRPKPPPDPYKRFEVWDEDAWTNRLVVPPMTRDEALAMLRAFATDRKGWPDREKNHEISDLILLMLLDDAQIAAAFDDVEKWYS